MKYRIFAVLMALIGAPLYLLWFFLSTINLVAFVASAAVPIVAISRRRNPTRRDIRPLGVWAAVVPLSIPFWLISATYTPSNELFTKIFDPLEHIFGAFTFIGFGIATYITGFYLWWVVAGFPVNEELLPSARRL